MRAENVEDIYELSPMQQGMVVHTITSPDSSVYIEQLTCTLEGDFNVSLFKQAWQRVLQRHPILRSGIHWEDLDKPYQVVSRKVDLPWELLDWHYLSSGEQQQKLSIFLETERRRAIDLGQPPLMRFSTINQGHNSFQFIWTFHHVLLDGWSVTNVLKEVFAHYNAFLQGDDLELAPVRPYRDFIRFLQHQDLDAAERIWRRALQGFSAPTSLAVARRPRRVPALASKFMRHGVELSAAVTAALEAFAREHRVTLNSIVQACWALLLARYSGEDDIVWGTTVSGRPVDLEGAESMVGLFINTLPTRAKLEPGEPVAAWIRKFQQQQVELRQYDYAPLALVQKWSEVPPTLPLFESIFVFENYNIHGSLPNLHGNVRVRDARWSEQTNYPLNFVGMPGQNLRLEILHDEACFEATTVERMLGHASRLLEATAHRPEARLGDLPLLNEDERRNVVVQWNDTSRKYPRDRSLQQLFEEQVARTPDAIAVAFGTERLTYAELNRRANQLAHNLRRRGVNPGVLVGVCLEPSAETIIAILGIVKAGGAYVPLDPTHPFERLAFMLVDTQAPVVVAEQATRACISGDWGEVILIDHDREVLAREPGENLRCDTDGQSLAYVMYTSGSTGRPKGIEIPHRAISRLVLNSDYVHLGTNDRIAQASNTSFDASTFEIWGALLNGARLVGIRKEEMLSTSELGMQLREQGITTLFLTTAVFNQIARDEPGILMGLHNVLFGGEAVEPRWVARVLREGPPRRLLHVYGPTETTTFATWYEVKGVDENATTVPIGYPIANTEVYLLDKNLEPVPPGVPGEIYIGGDGLAQGYLKRPDLTAQRFVNHPFDPAMGSRLYRTGDLALRRVDGAIEFLGRLDQQLKIRGFRIELGEIAAVLEQHPGISEAVVVPTEKASGDKQLVAYVVGKEKRSATAAELLKWAKEKLPDYMIPAAFVSVDTIPVNANGKIDYASLQARPVESNVPRTGPSPQTDMERQIAGIWEQVLQTSGVGVEDNFFDLGGHSLLLTQVHGRLQKALGRQFPIVELFKYQTISSLIARLSGESASESKQEEASTYTRPCLSSEYVAPRNAPLSFAQERIWFLQQLEPGTGAYNMAGAVRIRGSLNLDALEKTLNRIVARHEILRTNFISHDGEPRQIIARSLTVSPVTFDLSKLERLEREAEVKRLISATVDRPFDLARSPLLNVTLFRMAESEHILLLTMHHIMSDGWSLSVLFRELLTLYPALAAGKHVELPDLPLQYADFAEWQRGWLRGEVLERQLKYWRNRLNGKLPILALPSDRVRPPVQTSHGYHYAMEMPASLLAELNAVSRREGVTLFMTLMAAFQILLSRHTDQEDIIVGTPIAGRNRAETESMIGLFVNTLVLRSDLSGNPTFRELLHRVREAALEAYSHQDLPFGKLVAELQPERNLSYPPLFQVMFVLQNLPVPEFHLPGLVLSHVEIHRSVSKVDLTMEAAPTSTGLRVAFEYNTDLFGAARICRMANAWRIILERLASNPEQRIGGFPLLASNEWAQTVRGWNATSVSTSSSDCIHQLFEVQAAVSPEATAIVFEQDSLTYAELNERSSQLARFLQQAGVQPETLVGILMDRSPAMVIALLAVLKAGGAYVPLDPAYPQQRIAFMIADSGLRLVLTQTRLLEALAGTDVQAICVDSEWDRITQTREGPVASAAPENLAYLIYTSGSTGRPKGVQITHRAVVNFLGAMRHEPGLNSSDVLVAVTTLSFDIAVLELFLPLTVGARLVIASRDASLDATQLSQLLSSSGATTMQATPSTWRMLIEAGWMGNPRLKILCGGEALTPELAKQLLARGLSLWNMYGPTETTVWSAIHRITHETNPIVVGRPIANTQIYILDQWLNPVPIGVPGELHIGGLGLGRGYWSRPELTADKFIPDPFSATPGARLYKTGDLARYLPDGTIECLGRVDHQVKVRGFRIELGEIEAELRQFPGVRDCVVVAREDLKDDKRLVSYFVAGQEAMPSVSDLRSHLRRKLPEYMIPSGFVALGSIPRTPNGKVDRAALPTPDQARPKLGTSFVPPRNEVETAIAGIWQGLLRVERVGRDDNFFDLGGHSLLMVQVHSSLVKMFPTSLTILDLFRYPTIKSLAEYLSHGVENPVSFEKAQNRAEKRRLALNRTRQFRFQS